MDGFSLPILSKKEEEILALWLCGQTAKQSASCLGKSSRTIESHREKIKCKLGIRYASELHQKMMGYKEFKDIFQRGMTLILWTSQASEIKKVVRPKEPCQKFEPHLYVLQ